MGILFADDDDYVNRILLQFYPDNIGLDPSKRYDSVLLSI